MAATTARLILDGSTLEGGGQIVRNAVALAALTGRSIEVTNVRANRSPPGLKAQHATGLNLVADICGAKTEGATKASRSFQFNPGPIRAGDFTADPGTAGSTTLLLQIALPCLLFPSQPHISSESTSESESAPSLLTAETSTVISNLTLRGGTNALNAPQIDYTLHIFLPFLFKHFGLSQSDLSLLIKKRGYYPHGEGEVRVKVPALSKGQFISPVTLLDRGQVTSIRGLSYVSGTLPPRIATKMRDAAEEHLKSLSPAPTTVNVITQTTTGRNFRAGSGIVLWAETDTGCIFGGSALGQKGYQAKDVGTNAAKELIENLNHGGCVDEYLQDQIIIFMALANGKSTVKTGPLTLHTRTAIWVAQELTGAKFAITEASDDCKQTLISCDGIGLEGRLDARNLLG